MSTQKHNRLHHFGCIKALALTALAALAAQFGALAAASQVEIGGYKVESTHILASFKSGYSVANASTKLEQLGSKSIHTFRLLPNLVLLDDTAPPTNATASELTARLEKRIKSLQDSGMFEYVEPDYLYDLALAPNDQAFVNGTLWGLNNLGLLGGSTNADISATNAWDITTGSTNVIVAVIDTGVRYTHLDLAQNMWRNPGEIPNNGIDDDGNGFVDDVFGINALNLTGNPMDDNGHGSHVAGTIGAVGNNGPLAETRAVGVCWKVNIMALKIFNASGSGAALSAAIISIDYAIEKGARILNNSWGGGAYSQSLYDVINRARAAGVLFVAAAGNYSLNNDATPFYPASYDLDNIVSVAATDRYDNKASFSHYGPTTVDVGAPGVDILSCWFSSDTAYNTEDGTSMASPHVAGVAALILSKYSGADLAELRGRLFDGVDKIPALDGLIVTGGRVNAYRSLTLTGNGILQARVTPPSGSSLLAGSVQPIYVEVSEPPVSVNNATVTGNIPGVGPLTFKNDGVAPDAVANDRIYTAVLNVPAATNTLTMTVDVTAPGKVAANLVAIYPVVLPPVNDYFTNAIKAPAAGATYLSNNKFATVEAGEPLHGGVATRSGSLWWTYTSTVTTNVYLDTIGSGVDTVLGVYVGNTLSALSLVSSNDDFGPIRQAALSFTANANTIYRIAVASANSNQVGSLQLRIAPGGGPDITQPQVFVASPLNGQTVTTNLINVSGTAIDPALNSSGVSEVLVTINGGFALNASGTTAWNISVPLQAGLNTIRAQAVDAAGNMSPSVTVQITYVVPGPANDFFVNAATIPTSPAKATVDTTLATTEVGEPDHAGVNGGKSVWWKFPAPQDGLLFLSTAGSSFDTLLGVYKGESVTSLSPIIANDDAYPSAPGGFSQIVLGVRSNQTYRIAADGYDGVFGTLVLSNYFVASTVYQLTVLSDGGGTVSPALLDVPSNSTVSVIATPAANYLFDRWTGDRTSIANPLAVTVTSNTTISAKFRALAFTDGFESGDFGHLGWVNGGDQPWLVRTNDVAAGQFAARSGFITHGQQSSLSYSGDFQAGNVTFAYKVSSEAGFDFLKFLVDGVVQDQWSGEVGWVDYSWPITSGHHTLEWRYVKDMSLSSGADAGYLDNVNFPLAVTNTAAFRAQLEIERMPDGTTAIDLTGQPGQTYVFQSSTDMINWQSFSTNVAVGGFARAVETGTGNARHYFRAIIPVQ